ncbi:transposase [Micromonospora rosaria]|uniref:transposase n=1 Tax=Micromonospora rosaria TaxID=47874 RepID=UPI001471AD5F
MYAECDAPILELETMPSHVRLFVTCDPQYGIHRLVTQIKGAHVASAAFRVPVPAVPVTHPVDHSYFVATVGDATLEVVKSYVQHQRNTRPPLPPHG